MGQNSQAILQDTFLINGHRLYVQSQGLLDGKPLILLHHGLGSVRAWKAQIPDLVTAGYRVIAYDRWGYGRSDPRPRLSVPGFGDDLEDLLVLLDEMGLQEVALVGHSDGGTLALYCAAGHAERVACLVTVAAHTYIETKMQTGIAGVRDRYERDAKFRMGLRRMHGDKTEAVFYNWYGGWNRPENHSWDMRPIIRSIQCPTFVVQGFDDEHATPQHARDIAESISKAHLWLVPGARHMLPQEAPQSFNRELLAFLGRNFHHDSSLMTRETISSVRDELAGDNDVQ